MGSVVRVDGWFYVQIFDYTRQTLDELSKLSLKAHPEAENLRTSFAARSHDLNHTSVSASFSSRTCVLQVDAHHLYVWNTWWWMTVLARWTGLFKPAKSAALAPRPRPCSVGIPLWESEFYLTQAQPEIHQIKLGHENPSQPVVRRRRWLHVVLGTLEGSDWFWWRWCKSLASVWGLTHRVWSFITGCYYYYYSTVIGFWLCFHFGMKILPLTSCWGFCAKVEAVFFFFLHVQSDALDCLMFSAQGKVFTTQWRRLYSSCSWSLAIQ